MFRFTQLHLEQYRCFEALDLTLEPDLTVLFAENGGGKTVGRVRRALWDLPSAPNMPRAVTRRGTVCSSGYASLTRPTPWAWCGPSPKALHDCWMVSP